jgi:hypothetical protein
MELETQRLEEERQQLEQTKFIIEQKNKELKAREAKINEAEPLLPSVRQLQAAQINFSLIMQYMMAINERSAIRNIDLKTAAYDIGQIIHQCREIEGLHATSEMMKKQIESLDSLAAGKQALTTLMNLQMRGFSDKDVEELVLLVQSWNQSGITQLGIPGNGHGMSKKLDTKLIGTGN